MKNRKLPLANGNTYNPERRKFLVQQAATAGVLSTAGLIAGCKPESPDILFDPESVPLQPPVAGKAYPPRGRHVSFLDDSHTTRGLCWFTDSLENPGTFVQWDYMDESWSEADATDLVANPLLNETEGSAEKTTGLENITHKCTLSGLDASKAIRYRAGSETGGWSDVQIIKASAPADEAWTFLHFGDNGTGHRAQRLFTEIMKPAHEHDMLLIAGDIAYADGNHEKWDTWFDLTERYLKNRVTMTVPGNHESKDADVQDDNYLTIPTFAYTNRFHQPGAISYYGFVYNNIYFYAFTAGAFLEDTQIAQEMADLEAALSQASAMRAAGQIDFIVAFQHYTIWTDQAGRAPGNGSLIAIEEAILVKFGVDMVLAGHDHVYQRSKIMQYGSEDPTGTAGYVQVMTGCGGQSIRLFEPTISEWSAKDFIGVGFSKYEVNDGEITCTFYGSGPTEMETREHIVHAAAEQDFPEEDRFTVTKKPYLVAKQFVKPPRDKAQLLAAYNWEEVIRDTRLRNEQHMREHAHDHA